MKKRRMKTVLCVLLALAVTAGVACAAEPEKDYGVFLSETEDLARLGDYGTVVIDAQYFTKEEIAAFRDGGRQVYSYLNIGSLEDFRDYYETYKDLTLAPYENWEEEYWINIADPRWQSFLLDEAAPALLEKGIDGFFVDNCDVYYQFPTKEILDGVAAVMKALTATGKPVVINGGDTWLDAYCEAGGQWNEVITGINQESVFSKILWDGDNFGTADPEDREYFTDYVERYAALGAEIFLLEYTKDEALAEEIREYCALKGFRYYISDSIELD